jgi:hypothetical protein
MTTASPINIKKPVYLPPALSRLDLAATLGVSPTIIGRTLRRHPIPPLRKCGNVTLYSPEVLDVLRQILIKDSIVFKTLVQVGAQPAAAVAV